MAPPPGVSIFITFLLLTTADSAPLASHSTNTRFEVLPCSAARTWLDAAAGTDAASSSCINAEPQEIVPGANVTFSFDVRWQESETPWINRWDAYLAMRGKEEEILPFCSNSAFMTRLFFTRLLLRALPLH